MGWKMSIFLSFRLNSGFLWRVESSVRRHFACHVEARLCVGWSRWSWPRKLEYGISACNPKKSPWLKGNSFSKPIIFRLQPLVFRECIIFFGMIPSKIYFLTIILGREPPKFLTWFYFVLVLGWLQVQSDHRPSLGTGPVHLEGVVYPDYPLGLDLSEFCW